MGEGFIVRSGGGGAKIDVDITAEGLELHEASLAPYIVRDVQSAQFPDTGEVIVPGGYVDAATASSIIKIDVSGDAYVWGSLPAARMQYASSALGDDSIVVAGGILGSTVTNTVLRIYSDGTMTALPTLTAAKRTMYGITMGDKSVLIPGGYNASASQVNTVERIYPDGTKSTMPNLAITGSPCPSARFGDGSVAVLPNSQRMDRFHVNSTKTTVAIPSQYWSWSAIASLGDGSVAMLGVNSNVANTVYACIVRNGGTIEPEFSIIPAIPYNEIGGGSFIGESLSDGSAVFTSGSTTTGGTSRVGVIKIFPDKTIVRLPDAAFQRPSASSSAFHSPMKDGSCIFGGGSLVQGIDRYYPENRTAKSVLIPAKNKYKFQEHVSIQPSFDKDTRVLIEAPNTGFFYPEKGSITK